MVQIIIHKE